MDRKAFLQSRLDSKENIFNMTIPFREEHRFIFNRINAEFSPRETLTEDIRDLVIGDLNVCRQRNVLVLFKGNSQKLNTLKLFCLMNFIVNWKSYNNYIINLVHNNFLDDFSLSYKSSSLETILEMRFRDDAKDNLNEIYNVDILFLTVQGSSNLANNEFYADLLRTVLDLRDSKGLVTILIYLGTESDFKSKNFESKVITPMYKYDLSGVKTSKMTKKAKTSHNNFNSEINSQEVF